MTTGMATGISSQRTKGREFYCILYIRRRLGCRLTITTGAVVTFSYLAMHFNFTFAVQGNCLYLTKISFYTFSEYTSDCQAINNLLFNQGSEVGRKGVTKILEGKLSNSYQFTLTLFYILLNKNLINI